MALSSLTKSRDSAKRSIRRKKLKSATGDREVGKDGDRVVFCPCKARYHEIKDFKEELNKRVRIKEDELRDETEEKQQKHLQCLKEKFNNILRNEQLRTSHMLREANREARERVAAVQTRLECANMAALVYVACCERRRAAAERSALRDEYAAYVGALEQLLAESQTLVDDLVRGQRAAGRVEAEWRGRMRAVLREFVAFVEHFHGAGVAQCVDAPRLLQPAAPAPAPDQPCREDEELETESVPESVQPERQWWERLEDQPFVVFGDMADLVPGERVKVLKEVKNAARRAVPERWGEYAFNNLSLKETCDNWRPIAQKYKRLAPPRERKPDDIRRNSDADYRSRVGSIVRMIASNSTNAQVPKTSLLAAKDSLEIVSVTKMRSRVRTSNYENEVKLRIGNKIDDLFEERLEDSYYLDEEVLDSEDLKVLEEQEKIDNFDEDDYIGTTLGSMAADSMLVIPTHVPDVDHKISTEKTCPAAECARHSLLEALPPYMRTGTAHYTTSYEHYDACTPEQLKILERRIDELKRKEKEEAFTLPDPLHEWADRGVSGGDKNGDETDDGRRAGGDRNGDDGDDSGVPCTCPDVDDEKVEDLSVKKLYPIKQKMDRITKEFFFDERIQFDRFQVVGPDENRCKQTDPPKLTQVKELLQEYPSLCGLFEGTPP